MSTITETSVQGFRLSPQQVRLWALQQSAPGVPLHAWCAVRLLGGLDRDALEGAIASVVREHEMLRTALQLLPELGLPVQVVEEEAEVALDFRDLAGLPAEDRAAAEVAWVESLPERLRSDGPGSPLRAALFRRGGDDHVLYLALPAGCADRATLDNLAAQLADAYGAAAGDGEPEPAEAVQYVDFSEWLNEMLASEEAVDGRGFWRGRNPTRGSAPLLEPRSTGADGEQGGTQRLLLDAGTARRLELAAGAHGAGAEAWLLAAWQVLVQRHGGRGDFTLAVGMEGRAYEEFRRGLGPFARYVPLPADVREDEPFAALAARVEAELDEARAWQDFYAWDPQDDDGGLRSDWGFDYAASAPEAAVRGGVEWRLERRWHRLDLHGLRLSVERVREGGEEALQAALYHDGAADAEGAARLLGRFATLLRATLEDPAAPSGALNLLDEREREEVVVRWNQTAGPAAELPVHRLFLLQAARVPGASAIGFAGGTTTYAELEARTARLALALRERGVGPESRVGLLLERSPDMVAAILATLRAGAAYVPLDPGYPVDRLRFIAEDAGLALVLAGPGLEGRLGDCAVPVAEPAALVESVSDSTAELEDPAEPDVPGTGAAYVLYTSGSTGAPKGVVVEHRGLANQMAWLRERFPLGPDDVVLQKTPFHFDASVWEIFAPLLAGARLELAPQGSHADGGYLAAAVERHGVTVLQVVPSQLRLVLAAGDLSGWRGLRLLCSGGEALTGALAGAVRRQLPATELVNLYGPTETTVQVAYWVAEREEEGAVPIGRPILNSRLYVLDAAGRPVPSGVRGELYVGGAGVSRGYLGRPELTAARFLPDALGGGAGERLYRTGDVARWRPDGALEYLGRADQQVKVRGFRIELGEVEAVLEAHPGVRAAVVAVRADGGGEARLAGWWIPAGEPGAASAEELRDHLRGHLPPYMVPAALVELESFPLLPSGKVDRGALPDPGDAAPSAGPYEPPANPLEEALALVWAAILDVERVGALDNFFSLGGDSILSVRVVGMARDRGMRLTVQDVFEHQTVRELARKVAEGSSEAEVLETILGRERLPFDLVSAEDRARLPEDAVDAYPLASLQEGMLYHQNLTVEAPAYHNVNSYHFRGPFDEECFRRSVQRSVDRHDNLRTTLHMTGFSEPLQVVRARAEVPIRVEDIRHLDGPAQEAHILALREREFRSLFDLTEVPLMRLHVHRRTDDSFQLTLTECHAIADGWSTTSLFADIFEDYAALLHGEPLPERPLPPVRFRDFVELERATMSSGESRRFWAERLAGRSPGRLPRLPEPFRGAGREGTEVVALGLPPELKAGLHELARTLAVPIKSVFLAAHLKVLGLVTGEADVVTGLPTNGRPEVTGGTEVRGLFINTVPLRLVLPGGSWGELVREVFRAEMELLPHRRYPLALLQREHGPGRLFEASFNLVRFHSFTEVIRAGVVQIIGTARDLADTSHVLLAGVQLDPITSDIVSFGLHGQAGAFTREQLVAFGGYYRRVLEAMVADPSRRHDELAALSDAEREQLLGEWNATARPFSDGACLHHLIEAQARRAPGAAAVDFAGRTLTYGELDRLAGRLAHALRRQGVGPETRVALHLEPSPEMVVALLAVLKAGGAYVPLDTASPPERLAWVLADSGARLVLAGPEGADRLPADGPPVLRVAPDAFEAEPDGAPESGVEAHNLAYVIYTSGSTGTPKGVLVEHRGVVNSTEAYVGVYEIRPGSRVLLFAPLHFDASVLDVFTALCSGATLVVASREALMPGEGLVELLRRERVTHLKITPSALAVTPHADLAELEAIMVGGEACSAELVARWAPGRRFFNGYGATEHSVRCTAMLCTGGTLPPPVGRPVANARLYVLDAGLQPVPVGVPGEVYMAGLGTARGYLGLPGLSAERFLPDPFAGEPGARMYRSGDRGRWLPDGTLEFVGRVDFQLKIRGFRIEPGEVEAAVMRHPALADAVVVARGSAAEDRHLAAYVVPRQGAEAPPAGELRAWLRERLPEYMVPGSIVALDALPLTSNGKVDRRALPDPEAVDAGAEGYAAPRTPTEEILAGTWAQLLGRERVGARDDFFALGGHSLLATRLISRVRDAFRVEVPLRALFEAPTVEGFAARVDALLREGSAAEAPPIVPVGREPGRAFPLSFAQRRLWFIQRMDPGSVAYNMPYALRLRGELDPEALAAALGGLVRRQESLRTVFPAAGGEPVQVVLPAGPVRPRVLDLRHLSAGDREAELRRRVRAEAERPFDLAAGPLLRVSVLRLDDAETAVLFTLHHIVSDGWSRDLLVREVSELYAAQLEGREPLLPELPVQYADFAAWQHSRLAGEALHRQLGYWKERLAGSPPLLEIPVDRPRNTSPGARADERGFALSAGVSDALRELSRREGATLYMTLLAAFAALLSRWSGEEDVVVGSPVAGRTRLETEGLIGFFVNTLALRTDLSGDPTVRELVGRVRERVLEAHAHQDVPFEKLVEELAPQRSLTHAPLVQVSFSLQQGMAREALRMGSLQAARIGGADEAAKFDLALGMAAGDGGPLSGGFVFRTDLFDGGSVERLAERFRVLLEGMAADPERRLGAVPLLGDAERERVLVEWNATGALPALRPAHEAFAAQAARTPDALAVVLGGERLTYAELDRRSSRLAGFLRARGVGPETRVGVCLERAPEVLVALLGVLRAGGAYVPLDPSHPAERLAYVLEDAGVSLLLVQERLRERLPSSPVDVVALDAEWDAIEREPAEAPEAAVSGDELAYVIYTSGSTGRPKGVMVPHRGLAAYLAWAAERYPADGGAPVHSPLTFDLTVTSLLVPLVAGGTVALLEEARGAEALAGALGERGGFGLVKLTPGHLALLHEQLPAEALGAAARAWVVGGEALRPETAALLLERAPGATLVNEYGPTEAVVGCCIHEVDAASLRGGSVPIGRPVPGTRLYVLDRWMELAPTEAAGELYIGGAQLARGYRARPELTAERFVPDPFGAEPGARLYRTGDRARWRADGVLEYLGRTDEQVKVRGYRIEPGEVEAVLELHPDVAGARVVVREDAPGDARLVGYAVPREGRTLDGAALRAHLAARLPDYMVPGAVVVLEAFPLTPNGKVDRRALPAPEAASGDAYVAPRTPAEEILAGIWAEVLRTERVGVRDDFFALGGHSLLATRVVSRSLDALGVEVPLRALFEHPTVEGLAARVEALLREGTGVRVPPLVAVPRDGALPLSFAQQRLWFIEQLEPGRATYNMPAALRLRGALDTGVLARALSELARRHEVLRTVFRVEEGEPVQVVGEPAPVPLPVDDLRRLPAAAREQEVRRLAREEALRPFDLAADPPLRARVARLADEEWGLLFTLHHIAGDRWSMGVLVREVSELYAALAAGRRPELPALPVQYADYALWQRSWLSGEPLELQLAYWRASLAGAPPLLEVPTDRPRPAQQGDRGARRAFRLPAESTRALRRLAQAEGATLFMTLLSAWQGLLARYAGQEDVPVGTQVAGRTRLETEPLIGFFVNTLVLRGDLSGDPTFRELLGRTRETTLGAFQHQELPFEKLVEELRVERSLSHAPLFQVTFSFQNAAPEALRLGELRVEPLVVETESVKFDLDLFLREEGEELGGTVSYRTELFDDATIGRMMGHLRSLLDAVAADPQRRLSAVELLDPAERAQVLEEWNATDRPFPGELPVHRLFAAQAERTPGAVAVRFAGEDLTYAELEARSSRLARQLRRHDVGPEVRVGVCVERSPELVVALLGILKAGGAYVPVDPSHPATRLARMLGDARVPLVLAHERFRGSLPVDAARVLSLEEALGAAAGESAEDPGVEVAPDALAYVIHTSGSTGTPKGVGVPHRALANHMLWMQRAHPLAADDRVLQKTPLGFDASVWEFWAPLLGGATLVVAPPEAHRDPAQLVGTLVEEEVTVLQLVPSVLRVLLEEGALLRCTTLRRLFCGGEALTAELAERARAALGAEVVNLYGPTEACIDATSHAYAGSEAGATVPIGRPVDNLRAYVLDPAGAPAPAGVPGELYLAGAGLARGYEGRPELTAERFVPDPFGAAGGRLYRTGDRARWLAGGTLEFLGRTDAQVKVRGFRVEPGEIEAVLEEHPGVREAAVAARRDAAGAVRLVAYVVPAEGGEVPVQELRAHLRGRLPAHMVPGAVVVLDDMPRTRSGKTDRRALPAPGRALPRSARPEPWAAEHGREAPDTRPLEPAERERILVEWNATSEPYPEELCAHQLFTAQAERTPGAVALSFRGRRVTYAELEEGSSRLARALRERGVGPETTVGVCLERTPELVATLLGIWKAGGAYVPLDPAYPRERLAYLVEDCGARLVVTESRLAGLLPAGVDTLCLDAERARLEALPAGADPGGATPRNRAYVIYTSGSTGTPKGVEVEHRGVAALLHWLGRQVRPEERAGVLAATSLSFDVSVAEIFDTLCRGGRLVLVENALELGSVPREEEVRLAYMAPSAAGELLRGGGIPASLRTLNLAGEALSPDLVHELFEAGVERVVNIYGPTEDTVYATCSVVQPGTEQVTIGRPIANERVYVLDPGLEPVPVGVVGELFLSGPGVARGYLGQPGLTADRFVPDPFGGPGTRMYRTGDQVRWLDSGEVEYLGRIDQQVKVRGIRIELGEIEAVLRHHPAVHDAVVAVREDASTGRRLVAYAVTEPDAVEEIRRYLREHLPAAMVPAAVVPLEHLPLNASGKVDRQALPAPARADFVSETRYLRPETELEAGIAALWQELLDVEYVGAEDNFFDLGGHSLLLVRLQARIRGALGREVPLMEFFQYPTVRALAGWMQGQVQESAAAEGEARGEARQAAVGRRMEARRRRGS